MITYACFGKRYGTSCLALTLFGSYNRVCLASLRYAQIPAFCSELQIHSKRYTRLQDVVSAERG